MQDILRNTIVDIEFRRKMQQWQPPQITQQSNIYQYRQNIVPSQAPAVSQFPLLNPTVFQQDLAPDTKQIEKMKPMTRVPVLRKMI